MRDFLDSMYHGNVVMDENAPKDTVCLFNPKYKTVPVGDGEPRTLKVVIDWDATAKASAVIFNIREGKK